MEIFPIICKAIIKFSCFLKKFLILASRTDVIVNKLSRKNEGEKCFYGKIDKYDINTVIKSEEEGIHCVCSYPPLFTCFKI